MRSPSAAFDDAIRAGARSRVTRVWSLDASGEPVALFDDVVEAQVVADRSGVTRRTGTLTLANPDRRYRLEPGSLFAFDRCRIERGLALADGTTAYVSLLTGVTSEPELIAGSVSVEVADLSAAFADAAFDEAASVGPGTRVAEYARTLLIRAGLPDLDAVYGRLDDYGKVLTADVHHDQDDPLLDAIAEVAAAYGLRFYFDADGYAVLAPVPVLAELEPAWTFRPGPDNTGQVRSKRLSFARVRNRAIVRSERSGRAPIVAEARDLNRSSPFYNPPPGHPDRDIAAHPDRPVIKTTALLDDANDVAELARVTLQDHALAEEQVAIEAAFHPGLDEEDVIAVASEVVPTDALYVVDAIRSSSRALGATLDVRRVRSLTA